MDYQIISTNQPVNYSGSAYQTSFTNQCDLNESYQNDYKTYIFKYYPRINKKKIITHLSTDEYYYEDPKKRHIFEIINNLFLHAKDIFFEDGFENEFSKNYIAYAGEFKAIFLNGIVKYLSKQRISSDAGFFAIKLLGEMDFLSDDIRLEFFTIFLFHRFVRYRNAAIIGLSLLKNPLVSELLLNSLMYEEDNFLICSIHQVLSLNGE